MNKLEEQLVKLILYGLFGAMFVLSIVIIYQKFGFSAAIIITSLIAILALRNE